MTMTMIMINFLNYWYIDVFKILILFPKLTEFASFPKSGPKHKLRKPENGSVWHSQQTVLQVFPWKQWIAPKPSCHWSQNNSNQWKFHIHVFNASAPENLTYSKYLERSTLATDVSVLSRLPICLTWWNKLFLWYRLTCFKGSKFINPYSSLRELNFLSVHINNSVTVKVSFFQTFATLRFRKSYDNSFWTCRCVES